MAKSKPTLYVQNESIEELKKLLATCDKRKLSKAGKALHKGLVDGCDVILETSDN